MIRKVGLALVAFLVATGLFFFTSSRDGAGRAEPDRLAPLVVDRYISGPMAQGDSVLSQGNVKLSPGKKTVARIFDEVTSRLKYQLEAKTWEPITDSDFSLTELEIQIHTPKGQITYIEAARARVSTTAGAGRRVDPKRGWLEGGVTVTIDRTTSEWRKANPDLADRYLHPGALIHITMPDARFDMELSELRSEGDILIDSPEARIDQVKGLTLNWNQLDNRVEALRFAHGGVMTLRRGGNLIDFALPGVTRAGPRSAQRQSATILSTATPNAPSAPQPLAPTDRARAMTPIAVGALSANAAAEAIRLEAGAPAANAPTAAAGAADVRSMVTGRSELLTDEALADAVTAMKNEARAATAVTTAPADTPSSAKHPRSRISTYRAIFKNSVVVEQLDGLRTVGKLEANQLEVNFDFGRRQREFGQDPRSKSPTTQPATPDTGDTSLAARGPIEPTEDRAKLVLTWDGPLEMQPIYSSTEEQTGERFDAIAVGRPVRITSEQGRATCEQMVYRHERRQVWLTGGADQMVELAVGEGRALTAPEVFFDQKRGLAHVAGAGRMVHSRHDDKSAADAKPREPVAIRWGRSVDIELGTRVVTRVDPATGQAQSRQREFLRRAWFHGDVEVKEGEQAVSGEEVAATFGVPVSDAQVSDFIEHLDLAGGVRLADKDNLITSDKLEVDLVVAPTSGRNVPRSARAEGNVYAKQGELVTRAGRMVVLLTPLPDGKRMGIEQFDAYDNVRIEDPKTNMHIRHAASISAAFEGENRLQKSTIIGPGTDEPARVRYGEFAVHGHRVDIDGLKQSIVVEGPGRAWMVTQRDFGGRKLKRPTVVKTNWSRRMEMVLAEDRGVFEGDVRSTSETFTVDCQRLALRFGLTPPEPQKVAGAKARFWRLGDVEADKPAVQFGDDPSKLPGGDKRPIYIEADGSAAATGSTFAGIAPEDATGRLESRLRVEGEKIVVDLVREQMSVPTAGRMLIEDYRLPHDRARRPSSGGKSRMMSSDGPSQTLLTWHNAMDYFVDRGLAAFDDQVEMVHLAGTEMVLQKELAAAMRLDEKKLKPQSGRRATLACGNLVVEFVSGPTEGASALPWHVTDVRRLVAKQTIHLQDGSKSLMGQQLQYESESDEVRLEGARGIEARIIDQDERSQRLNMWRGPLLIWDRKTNRVEAPKSSIRSTRR